MSPTTFPKPPPTKNLSCGAMVAGPIFLVAFVIDLQLRAPMGWSVIVVPVLVGIAVAGMGAGIGVYREHLRRRHRHRLLAEADAKKVGEHKAP